MAMLTMMGRRKGNYMNEDAVEKVIRYITRIRPNEDRADELIAWSGMGVGCYASPELVIEQFCAVQEVYGIKAKGGRRIYHEVLGIREEEFERMWRDYGLVYQIAAECAQRYYSRGHQVVFAIHHAPKDSQTGNSGVHIHFAVNTVNFMTGRRWHSYFRESYNREQDFNRNMRYKVVERIIEPLYFADPLLDPITDPFMYPI